MNATADAASQFATIDSIVRTAYDRMPPEVWDYVSGGAGSETTLRRNRLAFERIGFCPALMRDVRGRDTTWEIFGHRVAAPIMLAPVGSIGRYHPDGPIAVAEVAEQAQLVTFVSSVAKPGIADVRARTKGPLALQLYVRGGRNWITAQVRAAEEAGCSAMCVTADAPVSGWRERNRLNSYRVKQEEPDQYQEYFTWRDVEWLRRLTQLPLMVKGIMSAHDARRAENAGCEWAYVSNHGGRQLDHLPATIDVLSEVIEAVSPTVGVLVDGGIVHGADVIKAIAMGARGVLIGKLAVWALAADGKDGLRAALDLLQREILNVMGLLGVTSLHELGPSHLREIPPAPLSDWPGFRLGHV